MDPLRHPDHVGSSECGRRRGLPLIRSMTIPASVFVGLKRGRWTFTGGAGASEPAAAATGPAPATAPRPRLLRSVRSCHRIAAASVRRRSLRLYFTGRLTGRLLVRSSKILVAAESACAACAIRYLGWGNPARRGVFVTAAPLILGSGGSHARTRPVWPPWASATAVPATVRASPGLGRPAAVESGDASARSSSARPARGTDTRTPHAFGDLTRCGRLSAPHRPSRRAEGGSTRAPPLPTADPAPPAGLAACAARSSRTVEHAVGDWTSRLATEARARVLWPSISTPPRPPPSRCTATDSLDTLRIWLACALSRDIASVSRWPGTAGATTEL